MAKDPNTPLILWICAAVCAHYMFAEGGGVIARMHEDRQFLEMMGRDIRERVRTTEQTFEVASLGTEDKAKEPEVEPPKPPPPKPEAKKPEEKKPEPPKPEAKRDEEKKKMPPL